MYFIPFLFHVDVVVVAAVFCLLLNYNYRFHYHFISFHSELFEIIDAAVNIVRRFSSLTAANKRRETIANCKRNERNKAKNIERAKKNFSLLPLLLHRRRLRHLNNIFDVFTVHCYGYYGVLSEQ